MSNILTLLREKTAVSHQALHEHDLLAPLQDNNITLDDYYWCIRAFHRAYANIDSTTFKTSIPDTAALEWLKNDMDIHAIEEVNLTIVPYPTIKSNSTYLGYLYVKQGSTLGGRIISKHLHKNLGLVEHKTNHFFAGFGDETGERWKQFLHFLLATEINHDEVIAQAISTFKYIADCCDQMLAIKLKQTLGGVVRVNTT